MTASYRDTDYTGGIAKLTGTNLSDGEDACKHPFQENDMAKPPNFLFSAVDRGGCFAFPDKDKGILIIYTLNPDTVEMSTIIFTSLLDYLHKNSG